MPKSPRSLLPPKSNRPPTPYYVKLTLDSISHQHTVLSPYNCEFETREEAEEYIRTQYVKEEENRTTQKARTLARFIIDKTYYFFGSRGRCS